jgi:hypothetical protein
MERFVPDLQQLAALVAIGQQLVQNFIGFRSFFFGIAKVVAHEICDVGI